jgi:hypothetical protein
VEHAVFALDQGAVAGGLATANAAVIARVVEKVGVTAEQMAAARDGLRTERNTERPRRRSIGEASPWRPTTWSKHDD